MGSSQIASRSSEALSNTDSRSRKLIANGSIGNDHRKGGAPETVFNLFTEVFIDQIPNLILIFSRKSHELKQNIKLLSDHTSMKHRPGKSGVPPVIVKFCKVISSYRASSVGDPKVSLRLNSVGCMQKTLE